MDSAIDSGANIFGCIFLPVRFLIELRFGYIYSLIVVLPGCNRRVLTRSARRPAGSSAPGDFGTHLPSTCLR